MSCGVFRHVFVEFRAKIKELIRRTHPVVQRSQPHVRYSVLAHTRSCFVISCDRRSGLRWSRASMWRHSVCCLAQSHHWAYSGGLHRDCLCRSLTAQKPTSPVLAGRSCDAHSSQSVMMEATEVALRVQKWMSWRTTHPALLRRQQRRKIFTRVRKISFTSAIFQKFSFFFGIFDAFFTHRVVFFVFFLLFFFLFKKFEKIS